MAAELRPRVRRRPVRIRAGPRQHVVHQGQAVSPREYEGQALSQERQDRAMQGGLKTSPARDRCAA
jgi:hypothetical protein